MQGVHLLVDSYNGFAGLGSGILEQLHDDYGNKGIQTFGLSPSSFESSVSIINSLNETKEL